MRLEEVVGVVGKPPGHDDIDDDNDDDDEVMMMTMTMTMIMMVIILMRLVTHRHVQLGQIQAPGRSRGAAGGA